MRQASILLYPHQFEPWPRREPVGQPANARDSRRATWTQPIALHWPCVPGLSSQPLEIPLIRPDCVIKSGGRCAEDTRSASDNAPHYVRIRSVSVTRPPVIKTSEKSS